jgi:hypothetical protein
MNDKSKLRGVTSFLAISASVVSACVCVLFISDEYHSANFEMDTYNRELRGWEACRQTNPAYFKANEQAVNTCLTNIDQARDNFWVKLPKSQLAALLIFAGLVSALGGYLITWVLVWCVGFGIYKLVRFFAFFLNFNANRQKVRNKVRNKNKIPTNSQRSRKKLPLCTKNGAPDPAAKPVGAGVPKSSPTAQLTSSNSSEQVPIRAEGEKEEIIINEKKEKQQVLQRT